jgi:hypothetical protein
MPIEENPTHTAPKAKRATVRKRWPLNTFHARPFALCKFRFPVRLKENNPPGPLPVGTSNVACKGRPDNAMLNFRLTERREFEHS